MNEKDNQVFIRVTNRVIYEKLNSIHDELTRLSTKVKIHDKIIFAIFGLIGALIVVAVVT